MLQVEGLQVSYGLVRALDGIDMYVDSGESVGVIGSNRAGKTTLLKAISGLVPSHGGRIIWQQTTLSELPAFRVPRLGVAHVPEGRQVFAMMNVEDNLLVGASVASAKAQRAEGLEKAYALFPRLAERRQQLAGTLSGGEQQMLAIARALMLNPSLLLLDEPSMGLAPIVVDEVYARIQDIRQMGLTVLLVEQNMHLALECVQRCYVLENGRIVLAGTAQELKDNPRIKEAYLGI
jgi:branched-chain amino acid transport system ATP-binding protein